jgi:hypothetical protein
MVFSVVFAALLVFGSTAIAVLLTSFTVGICWAPRIGGVLVGLAVFAQGYMIARPERFTRLLRSRISLQQRIQHVSSVATVFGTFLWAFGDLVPPVFGFSLCLGR